METSRLLMCMLVAIVLSTPAYAHKVMVFGCVEEGQVHLEGYFADGKKAENTQVEVFAEDGQKLLEGKTDEQGVFSFPMPDVSGIRVVLTASMGHRAECVVHGEKGARAPKEDSARAVSAKPAGKSSLAAAVFPAREESSAEDPTPLNEERIRAIVAEELERKLEPLMREVMMPSRHTTSLTDVIGGIGYIAGIMGLIMYFKARRGSGT
ncbi:MAG TPA: hypothetical protein PLT33_06695 [Deltaproteobacteria bacterium]|jgi:nickel transport protein|nr:hypothetical protein [Deltaproteobacteria bacterium]OQC22602.1 MAG: hypothetical protein BWX71_02361 [Deltaproteobacteria bacterium ADurb.Bin072]HRW80812.1 hypothetical protein [Desulfomonilia bacterium]HNQ85571.1 hypothetical protein [Deltaproteobacteria bacterium]HNS89083.1 hypothetical protein [Deltaproteobacteria bacterium]